MSVAITRDYSLVGPKTEKAIEAGSLRAEWYKPTSRASA